MGSILEPFSNIVAPGSFQVPTGNLSIDWSNPLSMNLQAAYVPGVSMGKNIAGLGADLAFGSAPQAASRNISADGPGLKHSVANDRLIGTATTAMITNTDNWSIFWRGTNTAVSSVSDNTMLFGISYDNAGSAPYYSYCFTKTFSTGLISIAINNGVGNPADQLIVDGAAYGANVMMSIGAIINPQAKTRSGYLNGKLVVGPVAWAGNPTGFGTSPQIVIGDYPSFNRPTNTITNVAYIWNRALSDAEHAFLAQNPYSLLSSAEYELPVAFSPPPTFVTSYSRNVNINMTGP